MAIMRMGSRTPTPRTVPTGRRPSTHRVRGLVAASALMALSTAAGEARELCPADASRVLAPATPEEAGLASGALARLVAELRANEREVHGLIVSRHCRTVVELYATGIGRDHNHALYSVTKSVVVTLVGHLLQQGKLAAIDVPVADLLPRPAAVAEADWQKLGRIRLAHVLSMSSGLAHTNDPSRHPILNAANRLQFALRPPLIHEPGQHFQYSNGDASIAAAVVAARAGSDLGALADRALFRPLGFENTAWWFVDKTGLHPGGWGLRLRLVDMAKFGLLWLQRGHWQGQRIFAADFADRAWSPAAVPHYGLYWWRNRRPHAVLGAVRMAVGFKGQRIFLVPEHGIVVAMTANLSAADEMALDNLVIARLAEALRPAPRAGSVGERKALADQLARPFAGKPGRPPSDQDTPRAPEAKAR